MHRGKGERERQTERRRKRQLLKRALQIEYY